MQEAKITVVSAIRVGEEITRMETVSFGTYTEKNGRFYVRYAETEASGMAGSTTTLKWDLASVTLLRHGTYELRQTFVPGGVCCDVYRTPYLVIPLETQTESVLIRRIDIGWQLFLTYKTIVGMQEESVMNLEITVDLAIKQEF